MIQPRTAARGQGPEAGQRTPAEVLEQGLSAHFGRPVRVTALEGEPLETSSHSIDRLQVLLDSGERLRVVFKRLRPGHSLYGNEREVPIYRRLLVGGRFGAPTLYASVYDEARGRYWLFLEDLGEGTLKGADWDDWLAAARLLAEMHGTYLGREDHLRALRCLREHGPAFYQTLAATARECLGRAGARRALSRFDGLMRRFDSVVAYLVRQPRTLVHGDVFPRNFILRPLARPCLVDWESAAIGLAAWDLARLLDGWGEDRPALLAAYRDELERHAAVPVGWLAFHSALALCDLLNILWHLCWSVERCSDTEFVDALLAEMDAFWRRLDEEGIDG